MTDYSISAVAIIMVGVFALLLGLLLGGLLFGGETSAKPQQPTDPASAVFATVSKRITLLELDRRWNEAIMDYLCDTTRMTVVHAVQTSDFIHRLLDASPALSDHQRRELLAIADELVATARQAPRRSYEQALSLSRQPPNVASSSLPAERPQAAPRPVGPVSQ